jgi:hypothetical protein
MDPADGASSWRAAEEPPGIFAALLFADKLRHSEKIKQQEGSGTR